MLAPQRIEEIYTHYNNPAVAAAYAREEYITPCEKLLFSTYVKPDMAILDIGVGGGRTSRFLAGNASRYVGIDYAAEMVRACRTKYPQWEYLEASATDLSLFESDSFDVVLLSYNVLDDLIPNANRWRCLQECHRVLRDHGLLIFSSHNPRAILVRVDWESARRPAGSPGLFRGPHEVLYKALEQPMKLLAALRDSLRRASTYGSRSPFWRGEGYMRDMEKLMTHFWVPRRALSELSRHGFKPIKVLGDDYPRKSHCFVTEWYYYVFSKLLLPGQQGKVTNVDS